MTDKNCAIVQACGAKYRIKKELLDETDVDDVVVALVNLARNVCYIFYFNMFLVSLCPLFYSFQPFPRTFCEKCLMGFYFLSSCFGNTSLEHSLYF